MKKKLKSKNRRQRAREHALLVLENKGLHLSASAPWDEIVRGLARFGLASPGRTRGSWLQKTKPGKLQLDCETGSKRPADEVAERYRRARHRFKASRWREENDPLTVEFRAIVCEEGLTNGDCLRADP